MIADEIYSVYLERQLQGLECKSIEIRADLCDKLLHEIATINPVYCSATFGKPYKIYGMEIKPVRATEDYRFMIMD